jgi:hypothetical protein
LGGLNHLHHRLSKVACSPDTGFGFEGGDKFPGKFLDGDTLGGSPCFDKIIQLQFLINPARKQSWISSCYLNENHFQKNELF